jgi:DNA-directed RNA polymerase subunit alpha
MVMMLDQISEQIRAGQLEEANRELDRISPDGEERAQVLFLRGFLLEAQFDHEGAARCYEEALGLDPEHLEAVFRLALLCDLHGEEDRATGLYERCAVEEVVPVNLLLNLAVLYEERGRTDDARACVERVLAQDPNHTRARYLLRSVEATAIMVYDDRSLREREKRDAILDQPISDFELSVRSRNCLKQMDIQSIGDLLSTSEEQLLSYKNFGETSLNEIKTMLTNRGLRLGQRVLGDRPEAPRPVQPVTAPGVDPAILHKPVSELELSVRSRKCLQRLGITSIGELVMRSEGELLAIKNFGITSLREIKEQLSARSLSLRT